MTIPKPSAARCDDLPAVSRARRRKLKRPSQSAGRAHPRMVEALEPRLLMSAAPIGNVDIMTRTTIAGWAYSAVDGAAPETITVEVNGTDLRAGQTPYTASLLRADVGNYIGSLYHGFNITLASSVLAPGANTVAVYAQDSTGARTLLGQQTLTNPAPWGYVDGITSSAVSGWVNDADGGLVMIRVDVDGVAGTPVAANRTRADLQTLLGRSNVGFNISGDYAGKTVEVYAIDNPSGTAVLVGSNNHVPIGSVDVANDQKVAGWAYDADYGTDAVNIRVDIDGTEGVVTGTANLQRADLTSYIGSAAHGYSLTLPALSPGAHDVKVWALDADSSSTPAVLLREVSVTNTAPIGHLDVNNDNMVAGWAYDADAGTGPIDVSLYIDYQLYQTVSANVNRPDLTAAVGSANHGFRFDVSSIPAQSHSVTVTMHDSAHANSDEVVLYDDFVHNTPPTGALDTVQNNTVYGWAYDADMGSGAINVDLYVDDAYVSTVTANLTRNDLTSYLGSANHGYAVPLPMLSFGTHKVEIFASESQGLVSQRIGSTTVINGAPLGNIDVANTTMIAGWAADFDNLSSAVQVKLMIDDVDMTPVAANVLRGDLVGYAGDGRHGFTISLPTLTPGQHELGVFAIDLDNGQAVSLGTRLITV